MKIYSNNYIDKQIKDLLDCSKYSKDFTLHLQFITSYIRTFHFKDRRIERDSYVPMNAEYLRNLISKDNSNSFTKALLELGIIETDSLYTPREKSMGYRLNEDCYKDPFYLVEVKDKRLEKKVSEFYQKLLGDVIAKGGGRGYVTSCMNKVNLDKETAITWLHNNNTAESDYAQECRIMLTELFEEKFAKIDRTGQRLHNNLTNLYRGIKQFLTYGEERENLVQWDIKNSQLVFMYSEFMDKPNIPKSELEKFAQLVCEQGFYEYFADKLNIDISTSDKRSSFKKILFRDLMFGKNKIWFSKIEKLFKEAYPNIFREMRYIKKDNHNQLAILLQRAESTFIFNCVEELMVDGIPLLTIHDSIATTIGNEDKVLEVINRNFMKLIDRLPTVKMEKFGG